MIFIYKFYYYYYRVGTLGKDIKSFIDTRKAGPGELSLVNAYELTKLIV